MINEARDVIIIGGGIGGLTAATYLGRFRRPALIIDAGAPRARWIPKSHNIPGFPAGIGGVAFLSSLRAQAGQFGAEIRSAHVSSIATAPHGFDVHYDGVVLATRYLIVATGVEDHLPALEGAEEALQRSVLRVCPICDGYEASGKQIAVLGDGSHGENEAGFLRTYSDDVTYLHLGETHDPDRRDRMAQQGIELLDVEMDELKIRSGALEVRSVGVGLRRFDVFYAAMGCQPRTGLVAAIGATCDEKCAVKVDEHQMTSVDCLYAVGDMVRGLNQVIVAAAEAAVAVTEIHNRLRRAGR